MKKSLLVFILICTIVASTSCTLAPDRPSDGVWHCEELKLVVKVEERDYSVYSYDENLSHIDLQVICGIDGCFDIVSPCDNYEVIEIYNGWRKSTKDDKFTIRLYSKANPEDNYRTQIELDDEEYTFVKIDNYDEIDK